MLLSRLTCPYITIKDNKPLKSKVADHLREFTFPYAV